VTAHSIQERFVLPAPLLLSGANGEVTLEIKPYLQPFERELAMRELKALLNPGDKIHEEFGYWLAHTSVSDEVLRSKLTYWQRIGRTSLKLPLQKALELTQNGEEAANQQASLHRARRLRYGPHGLHEYRGKFFPQLVRSLINMSGVPEGSLILDPMSGSGTTACEAVAAGMRTIGADLNPLSTLITSVKAAIPTINPEEFRRQAADRLPSFRFKPADPATIWGADDLRYLHMWLDPVAVDDLASVISEIEQVESAIYRDFFCVCLSNIVRSVSWQKPEDLRTRKQIGTYEPGTALSRFLAEAQTQADRIHAYLLVLGNKKRPKAVIRHGNALEIESIFPEYSCSADLLITSPPYATALPYLDTDRLSLIVMRLLPRKKHVETEREMIGTREITERKRREAWAEYEDRQGELPARVASLIDAIAASNHADGVGFRRRNLPALLGKYFLSMLDAMRSARKLMKPGALGYYVVGNNSTVVDGKKIEIPTDRFLVDLGAAAGWSPVEQIPMELIASRDIFRENRGSTETILGFRA